MKTNDETLAAILKKNKEAYENGWKNAIVFNGIFDLKDFIKEWRELDTREKLEAYISIEDGGEWDDAVYKAKNEPRIIGEPGDTIEELCQSEFAAEFEMAVEKTGIPLLEFAVTSCIDWEHLSNEWMLEASISETTDPETGWPVYYYDNY